MTEQERLRADTGSAAPMGRSNLRVIARLLLDLLHAREKFLYPFDASGPCWPLMLVLFGADSTARPLSVGDVSFESGIPRTTAMRWLRELDRHGLVALATDRRDKRVVRVRLTGAGDDAMRACLSRISIGS